jgi:hypothetical protein
MSGSTITVRFDKYLYDRVKDHWMCTSDLIRNGVEMYLDELEEKEKQFEKPLMEEVARDDLTVRSYEIQDVEQVKPEMVQDTTLCYEEKTGEIFFRSKHSNHADDTFLLMGRLKNEVDELDSELEELMRKYRHLEKKY